MTGPAPRDDELLPPGDAAALLGISVETLGRWARQGVLPSQWTRPGGHRRFRRSAVENLQAAAAQHDSVKAAG